MTDLASRPDFRDRSHTLTDFKFESGQTADELRLRYLTLGTPLRNDSGNITNAILLLHTTTSSAEIWLEPSLADHLFGPDQPLDADKYFIVIPDMIGFGKSAKPSNGLRANFPNYRYSDHVRSTYRLLTEALNIDHLQLVLGISMGGMLSWMWAEIYPDFMDAVVPISCQPGPMSGRNWIQRRISIEAIRNDPEWNGGDYETNPSRYVYTAPFSALLTRSVVRLQEAAPTRREADALYEQLVERARKGDANDRLYQVESSMDYDPSGNLDKITAKLLTINFEDDELNPPALGVVEPAIAKIPGASQVLIPAGPNTLGHFTGHLAALWAPHVKKFMTVR